MHRLPPPSETAATRGASLPGLTLRRRVLADDPAAVRAIARSSGLFAREDLEAVKDMARQRLLEGPACGRCFLFIQQGDGPPLGFACHGPDTAKPHTYRLLWIAVEESLRRQGIGSLLLEAVERAASLRGAGVLLVETLSGERFAHARHFYEAHGFTRRIQRRNFVDQGEDLIIYAKTLRSRKRPHQSRKAA